MNSRISRASVTLFACLCVLHFDPAFSQIEGGHERDKPIAAQGRVLPPCMEFEQMPLTENHILGLLASADEIDDVRENSADGFEQPGAATTAKLDLVARKNGLAGYEEYRSIRANVILVFSGYDRVKGRYVGYERLLRLRVARTKADRTMSAEAKKEEIESLQLLCTLPEIKYKRNSDLVHKYYARLSESKFHK